MWSLHKSSDKEKIEAELDRFVHDLRLVAAKRRLNFLEKIAKGVCSKLDQQTGTETSLARRAQRASFQ